MNRATLPLKHGDGDALTLDNVTYEEHFVAVCALWLVIFNNLFQKRGAAVRGILHACPSMSNDKLRSHPTAGVALFRIKSS